MRAFRMYTPVHAPAVTLFFALMLLLGNILPVTAAPSAQTFGGDPLNVLPLLFPELLTMPAPAWVREGSTFPTTCRAPPWPSHSKHGAGGAGYMQHDIVAVGTTRWSWSRRTSTWTREWA